MHVLLAIAILLVIILLTLTCLFLYWWPWISYHMQYWIWKYVIKNHEHVCCILTLNALCWLVRFCVDDHEFFWISYHTCNVLHLVLELSISCLFITRCVVHITMWNWFRDIFHSASKHVWSVQHANIAEIKQHRYECQNNLLVKGSW